MLDILGTVEDSDHCVTVLDNEDCTFQIMCMSDNKYTLHIEVHNWSKDTLKRMLEVWPDLLNTFDDEGIEALYALVPEERVDSSGRFATMFGMEPKKAYDFTFEDGTVKKIWVYKTLTSPERYV